MKEKQVNEVVKTTEVPQNKKNKESGKVSRFFRKIGRKFKEMFSELGKVSWPTFGKVVKNTGIVLVVIIIFLIIISAFDYGLGRLLDLVTKIAA